MAYLPNWHIYIPTCAHRHCLRAPVALLQRSGSGVVEQTPIFGIRASFSHDASWYMLYFSLPFSPSQTSLQALEFAYVTHIVAACNWHFTTPLIFAKFKSSCFCFKLFWGKCLAEGPTCICRISFWIKCQIQFVSKDCICCRLNRETAHIATGVHWIFPLKKCIPK